MTRLGFRPVGWRSWSRSMRRLVFLGALVAACSAPAGDPQETEVVSMLTSALRHPDPDVRQTAALMLGSMGPDAGAAVPQLIEGLRDEHMPVRLASFGALGAMGPAAEEAVAAVESFLADDDPLIGMAAYGTLGVIGASAQAAVPALVEALENENVEVVALAAETLGAIGGPDAVRALVTVLQRDERRARAAVIKALGTMGVEAAAAVPALIPLLENEPPHVRRDVAEALGAMGPAAAAAVPALITSGQGLDGLLEDSDAQVISARIVGAMVSIGLDEGAVSLLVDALRSPSTSVRWQAARTLGHVASAAERTVPALIDALRDTVSVVSRQAALALGRIGPAAEEAVPDLAGLLRDPSRGRTAAGALGAIGTPAAVRVLGEALRDPVARIRERAADALGGTGPAGRAAVSALVATLRDQTRSVRDAAINALGALGPAAEAAVPALVAALEDASSLLPRPAVTETLGRIGPAASAAVPALRDAFVAADRVARRSAVSALLSIDSVAAASVFIGALAAEDAAIRRLAAELLRGTVYDTAAVVSALIPVVLDPDAEVRLAAIRTLGTLGPSAETAVPSLLDAAQDPNLPGVRRAAMLALGDIGPSAGAAVPTLVAALEDGLGYNAAARALGRMEAAGAALPRLTGLLEGTDVDGRIRAAGALGEIGAGARPAYPQLTEALRNDPDIRVRASAASALRAIDSTAAVEVFMETLRDGDRGARVRVVAMLGEIGSTLPSPNLAAALSDEDPVVRRAVVDALREWAVRRRAPR